MKTSKRKTATTGSDKARATGGKPKSVRAPAVAAAPVIEPVVPVPAAPASGPVSSETANSLVLASVCTVREAAALKDSLLRLLDADDVLVDAGALERIDTAAIQLLCAFVRDRAAADRKVTWKGESIALRAAARVLGVSDLLALGVAE